jgi:hypothetical protein
MVKTPSLQAIFLLAQNDSLWMQKCNAFLNISRKKDLSYVVSAINIQEVMLKLQQIEYVLTGEYEGNL